MGGAYGLSVLSGSWRRVTACATSSARVRRPSLVKTWCTWVLTVLVSTCSRSAIWGFDYIVGLAAADGSLWATDFARGNSCGFPLD